MMGKLPFPLINMHAHAAMNGLRGLAEDLPLKDWLEKVIWPAEKAKVDPDFAYRESRQAILEMRRNGIAAFADMYFFEEETARAAEELEMAVLIGEGILDFPTPSAATPDEAFARTEMLIGKYADSRFVKVAVAPHSIYAVSEANLIRAKELAAKHGVPLHIHLSETAKEVTDCQEKTGLTPVAYLDRLGLLGPRTIAAHCVRVTEEDMDILAERKVLVAHCPLSNLKLGSGIAPVARMLEKGVRVALGTDGAASSNRLDIWEAGKFASLLQKGLTGDPSVLPEAEVFRMMALNGLEAFGLEELDGRTKDEIARAIESVSEPGMLYFRQSEG